MTKSALIIVDLQNDFVLPEGKTPVVGAEKLPSLANQLIEACVNNDHFIVFSRDWHPRGHSSFRTRGEHCVAQSSGALLHRELKLSPGRAVVLNKGTDPKEDSASAFAASDGFFNLEHFLEERQVTDVFIMGLTLDGCVLSTALEAVGKGYQTFVIPEATRAATSEGYRKAFKELPEAQVTLVTTKEAIKLLGGKRAKKVLTK